MGSFGQYGAAMLHAVTPGSERLFVALDMGSAEMAEESIRLLAPVVGGFKVGLELVTAIGAKAAVELVRRHGGQVFLDGKFHDIPNTMAGAARSAAALGVDCFTVHASAGVEGMRAAVAEKSEARVFAVTVLTSLAPETVEHVYGKSAASAVRQFAIDAAVAGCDGVVCSPLELEMLEHTVGAHPLLKVTPGVRPVWAQADDQKRVLTPREAILKGATHVVVGRPILRPPASMGDPVTAAKAIVAELAEAWESRQKENR